MWRPLGTAFILAATATRAVAAPGAIPLAIDVVPEWRESGLAVHVSARNQSDDSLAAVTPEVRFRLAQRRADGVALAPGDSHDWTVTFPPPDRPGGFTLVALLRWTDAAGRTRSAPFARAVESPGLLPTEAQVIVEPATGSGHERVVTRVTNATGQPLHGRLVAHLPAECFTTPVAQPIEVPPRETLEVPIDVQSGAPAGTVYPVYVSVEFEQGGHPRAIVAAAELGVGLDAGPARRRPLIIGGAALLLAIGAFGVANRRAARRRRA